jgi:putative DNA primase/helicase
MISPVEAAQQLAEWGLCVLPAKFRTKVPSVPWKDYQDPAKRPQNGDIERLFAGVALSNYWVLMGPPSQTACGDCDNKATIAWLYALVGAEILDATPQVKTAKGIHFYFRIPEGVSIESWRYHEGDIQFDFQAGGTGVVAPPSIHESGVVYKWLRTPDEGWQDVPTALLRAPGAPASVEATPPPKEGLAALLAAPAKEGERNDWLTKVCGHLAKQNPYEDGYLASVRLAAKEIRPRLEAGEVERTAASVWDIEKRSRQIAAAEETGVGVGGLAEVTESSVSHLFAEESGGLVWYCEGRGWMVYDQDGGFFRESEDAAMHAVQKHTETLRKAAMEGDDKAAKTMTKALASARGVKAVLALAQIEPTLRRAATEFDADPLHLNVANGVLDLESGELLPHSPEHRFTHVAATSWDPEAQCPIWEAHLERIMDGDEILVVFMQRWLGRCLSGLSPSDNCRILMPYGTGANGKTVTVETVATVLGDYAATTDFTSWCVSHGSGGSAQRQDLVELSGKRLVTATESGYHHSLDEALLKAYTGGERVSPRGMYARRSSVYRPEFSLLLSTNHLPRLEGSDRGLWRRFLKVGFTVEIPEPDQDQRLMEKLRGEAPGILRWLHEGYTMWRARSLDPPTSVLLETAQYRDDIDWIGQFLEQCCVQTDGVETSAMDVYTRYTMWCMQSGIKSPLTAQSLAGRLAEKGIKRVKRGEARVPNFMDLELRAQDSPYTGVAREAAWNDQE